MEGNRKLFLGRFPSEMRESDVQEMFSKYTKIERIDIKTGFCFVVCETEEDAKKIIELSQTTPFMFHDKKINIELSRQNNSSKECYVCHQQGHIARNCPKQSGRRYERNRSRRRRSRSRSPSSRSRSPSSRSRSRSPRSRSRSSSRRRYRKSTSYKRRYSSRSRSRSNSRRRSYSRSRSNSRSKSRSRSYSHRSQHNDQSPRN
ncbi:arginine/serine-rich splicing factor, putative [Entamoeba dispar SAW760]|uniref:Arginine/serine-rich splicing factor, putative n=1 Tax=Entamoeba dispar (strain ATCC PRA-260 / SAW760) TaxID=370354 RepID=B0EJ90_ENTDS|nr:arginine/serine-rich splicing factor, putative [Entamoeba dispar SAW760]EDR25398.1 arginine/serine-rich splicing factor, putative [Entamoeba dispar SAW760]|eukprot:EDR25398.1 arginine/serine-rich splicing factor, putative [Entamoeba dispar SAW760]